MAKQSAGLLLYRQGKNAVEVLLVHPGGPFWAKKDLGAWSIPKGEFEDGEEPLQAAKREFKEELGRSAPEGKPLIPLGSAKQAGGKTVYAWAIEADLNVTNITSNTFTMEWPPKSGLQQEFSEVDKAAWWTLDLAVQKAVKGQLPLFEAFAVHLGKQLTGSKDVLGQASLF